MATPASRTVPSGPLPSTQGSPRIRDWSNLRTGEQGSAFRGISRGRGSRGSGMRGGRGSSTNLGPKGGSHPVTADNTPSSSPTTPSVLRKLPAPTTAVSSGSSEKAVNGSTERGSRSKPGSRNRGPPVVVTSTTSLKTSQTIPTTPSRSAHRRRRLQSGKTPTATKPPSLPSAVKAQNSRVDSAPSSQTILRKDVPPHLAAAHEAEVRHDIDALVERVRAVAMAENRPTTPGSHIDWAGDEDDSLPDLDDWGVTTTYTSATHDEDQSEEISPILEDSLKTLPEPNSEAPQEEDHELQGYNVGPDQIRESSIEPSFLPGPTKVLSVTKQSPDQCIIAPIAVEEPSSPTLSDGKLSFHPSLPPKPVAAMECLRTRGRSNSKPSGLPPKPLHVAEEETVTTETEGLAESMHAPHTEECLALDRVTSASSSERGLTASIHAPVLGLPESHSAPSLLTTRPTSVASRAHSRSQTEGRPAIHQPHSGPPNTMSHRHGRLGASSPLGKHYAHSRNHSTPTIGAGSRLPQTSRPVITGEAISRLARTIGGHGSTSRTQGMPVAKDSTISS